MTLTIPAVNPPAEITQDIHEIPLPTTGPFVVQVVDAAESSRCRSRREWNLSINQGETVVHGAEDQRTRTVPDRTDAHAALCSTPRVPMESSPG